jgi:hypothetical protein
MPTPRKHACPAQRQRAYRERKRAALDGEMRAKGMPALARLPSTPGAARWKALAAMAGLLLQTAQDEMQARWDDRSEAWQESERGEALQRLLDQVGEACECVLAIDS